MVISVKHQTLYRFEENSGGFWDLAAITTLTQAGVLGNARYKLLPGKMCES